MEDPKNAKGVVRREVVETITPGAAFADDLLDGARNNFLCALNIAARNGRASPPPISRRASSVSCSATPPISSRCSRGWRRARWCSCAGERAPSLRGPTGEGPLVTERERWEFDPALARDELQRQFGVASLEAFGIGASDAPAVGAAGALLRYLRELQPQGVPHLARPIVERAGSAMPLDEMTRRNLELVESLRGGDRRGRCIDVLDRTVTPMGARLLRSWMLAPLTERARDRCAARCGGRARRRRARARDAARRARRRARHRATRQQSRRRARHAARARRARRIARAAARGVRQRRVESAMRA